MGTQNPSVHPHAQARVAGDKHPDQRPDTAHRTGGLQHDNTRHTTRFTVAGNHLAQHPELSLLAIGLGTHLQSLPKGAPAGIVGSVRPVLRGCPSGSVVAPRRRAW